MKSNAGFWILGALVVGSAAWVTVIVTARANTAEQNAENHRRSLEQQIRGGR